MSDEQIEQQIQAKGLTAPRITPDDIEANIADEYYFTAADGVCGDDWDKYLNSPMLMNESPLCFLTFCVLVLRNGFTVTGESACASPENFDAELGRKNARQNAIQKIWPLMGYELRSKLARQAEFGCDGEVAWVKACACGPNEACSNHHGAPATKEA